MDNECFMATGKLTIANEDNTVIYGFTDLSIWNPITKTNKLLTANNPDKFQVIAESYEIAKSEFWARWKHFCLTCYQQPYIKIETN